METIKISRFLFFIVLLFFGSSFAQNNPPYLEPLGDFKIKEGELLAISLSAFDIDADSLTFSASNLPPGAEFVDSLAVLYWTPGYNQAESYSGLHFEVSDGQGGTDSENITITVINWPPGDVNSNGVNTLGDVIFLINYIFNKPGDWTPKPLSAGDFNLDGSISLADVIYDVNYIFGHGPSPLAKPELKIGYPAKGMVLNGTHWLNVENITGKISPGKVDLFYSSDSLNYYPLSYDTTTNPFYIFDTTDVNGLWVTDTFPSGVYYLKATYSDTPLTRSASAVSIQDETKVRLNRPPRPQIGAFYDQFGDQVIFVCQATNDPESDTILSYRWHFLCDDSWYQGPQAFKRFFQPETCQVVLEVRDQYHNVGVTTGEVYYTPPLVTYQDKVFDCQCESLAIIQAGSVPKNGGIYEVAGTSKLQYPAAKAHPDGNKKLGPLDHNTPLAKGGNQKLHIALYFMVEAKVNGDASQCSTLQMVNGTIKFDGATSGNPTTKDYVRPEDEKVYPYKANPTKAELGVKVAYTTPCGGTGKGKDFIEKKDGVIRWICTPGIHVAEEKDENQDVSVDKNFDNLFKNNGVEFNMFFWVEVIDKVQEVGCQTGKCKKCFLFGFKYDKDKKPVDMDNDGVPDPPKILKFVNCPTSLR